MNLAINFLKAAQVIEEIQNPQNIFNNNITEYVGIDFVYVITVCDNAKDRSPYFPTKSVNLHYKFTTVLYSVLCTVGTEYSVNTGIKQQKVVTKR
jgi:hypothetical protein